MGVWGNWGGLFIVGYVGSVFRVEGVDALDDEHTARRERHLLALPKHTPHDPRHARDPTPTSMHRAATDTAMQLQDKDTAMQLQDKETAMQLQDKDTAMQLQDHAGRVGSIGCCSPPRGRSKVTSYMHPLSIELCSPPRGRSKVTSYMHSLSIGWCSRQGEKASNKVEVPATRRCSE
jgi:hypothetical protein